LNEAYGWALLASHAVVWAFFAQTQILRGVTADVEPYCWPYFESCWQWRLPSYGHALIVMVGYLALILACAAAQWHQRPRTFRVGLVVVNLALFALVSLDYRLRANEFYMLLWIQSVYLCATSFRWTIPVAILSCYFWAGVLKTNHEWLSGTVLYGPLWGIPPEWVPVACAYVVFLELIAIWGLLARRTRWTIVTLLQLALFHIQSLSQIHWFYPALMATILSWFAAERFLGTPDGRATLASLLRGRAPRAAYVTLGVFALLQLTPHLYNRDSTLTGQGRVFALHMFEARQDCEVSATPTANTGVAAPVNLKVPTLAPRMVCDPLVYFNRAQNLCRVRRITEPDFDIHLTMKAKRRTDPDFTTIIDEPGFCAAEHEYAILRNNVWLQASWKGTDARQPH
jgi:hypothetical protein